MKRENAAMSRESRNNPKASGYGLVSSGGEPVPLKGVSIDVGIRGAAVLTTVSQRFRNDEQSPIEALYSFPLEENSSVCGFEVEIGARRIKGRVEEREKAFEIYDEAMKKGDSAFLLDQNRPDIFSVSVGRLLPGEEAVVRITYTGRTERFDKGFRLRVPTTISPRYIPPEKAAGMDPAELDAILPPVAVGGVPYGLSLAVDIVAGSAIRTVSCPSFPIRVSIHGEKAQVGLAVREPQLDQDFVLEVELTEPGKAGAAVCRDGSALAMMLRFRPVLPAAAKEPRDVVFIVDRSGSMSGESFEEARSALLLCLKSLEEGDRFNVVGFGSGMEEMFPSPVPYNQENLDRAVAVAAGWNADLGGTEILTPLKAVLDKAAEKRMLEVLLLTDGEVGNEADVIELARRNGSKARVFTFGIGRGASGTLVRGVAKATGGTAEFILPGERIEPKVMRQMARLSAPFSTDARLDWGGLEPTLAVPEELPAFCTGDEIDVLCRIPRLESTVVKIVGADGSTIAECPVDAALEVADDRTIALLLAREYISSIEMNGLSGGSAQTARKRKTVESLILSTALEYGLVSSMTSYVAVEEREGEDGKGEVGLRRVPVALTRGWGGTSSGFRIPGIAPLFAMSRGVLLKPVGKKSAECRSAMPAMSTVAFDDGGYDQVPESKPSAGPDHFMELVGLQLADGSWKFGGDLAALAGVDDLEALKAGIPECLREDEVLATLLALFLLHRDFAGRADEWALIAGKALKWLAGRGVPKPPDPSADIELADWLKSV